jgi:membrane protease subunit HflC
MNRIYLIAGGVAAILVAVLAWASLFTVHQTQQAIVMQFGDPKRVISEPGLNAKLPFIQNVTYYEKRILDLDPPVERMLLADQKPLNVDSFARYEITDPLRFYQAARTEGNLRGNLGAIINASLRSVLGNVNLASILSDERDDIMARVQDEVNREAERFGVRIVDLRIGRTDLPEEVSEAVYSRMRSEREREAAEFRAQGREEAQRIRASADREATVIRAEAQRESDIIRGRGEARRTEVLSNAYGSDENFFAFYRSMQAYENSINQGQAQNSYLVLSTEQNAFFNMFGKGAMENELREAGRQTTDGPALGPRAERLPDNASSAN